MSENKENAVVDPVRQDRIKERIRNAVIFSVILVCVAVIIVLATVIMPAAKYKEALRLYERGEYGEAMTAFTALKGYKDSAEQVVRCEAAMRDARYDSAVGLYEAGEYEEAIERFTMLNGYKDSEAMIAACIAADKEARYAAAAAALRDGDVVTAYETFSGLLDYKDSAELANGLFEQYKQAKLRQTGIGGTLYLGKYEQDNDPSNGKEDVEWIVLDKSDGRVLVISKYALDSHPYNSTCADVTWETCSLRAWLNDTFLNETFSPQDQERIITTTITADKNPTFSTSPGSGTTDRIFLLSIPEVERYFTTSESRMCIPTDYAVARGAGIGDSDEQFGRTLCWWVLRTPGLYQYYVSFVYYSGYVNHYGYEVSVISDAVRPAMWLKIEN